jgi:hypothetical protein
MPALVFQQLPTYTQWLRFIYKHLSTCGPEDNIKMHTFNNYYKLRIFGI